MKMRISHKLFLSLMITSSVSLITLMILFNWSLDRGFVAYLNQLELERQDSLVTSLQGIYIEQGSWEALSENPRIWRQLADAARNPSEELGNRVRPPHLQPRLNDRGPRGNLRPGLEQNSPGQRPGRKGGNVPRNRTSGDLGHRLPQPGLPREGDLARLTLFDANQERVIGPSYWDSEQTLKEIVVEEKVVGWLGVRPFLEVTQQVDVAFLKEQTQFAMLCFSVLILLAVLVSAFLARHFNIPIRALAKASRQLTQGQFDVRITSHSSDEIGQLTRDFDHMAQVLEKNRHARQSWISDISHELRTPLTILRGELDAVSDGIRPLNSERIASIRQETDRLEKMVNDLFELSLSDAGALDYHKSITSVSEILNSCIGAYQERFNEKGITLKMECSDSDFKFLVDSGRMVQLFNNLLENSLRYTDSPGQLHTRLRSTSKGYEIQFEDTAPGVSAPNRVHLFERLYRVDKSRSRRYGGAGLGLSICKNITEAHNGSIKATPSSLGGLCVTLDFLQQRSLDGST